MELFSKLYSRYYQIIRKILEEAKKEPIAQKQIEEIIKQYGFQESILFIMPKLVSGDWDFLKKKYGLYESKLKHICKIPLTRLQKSWLKAILKEPKMRLFLSEREIEEIGKELGEDMEEIYRLNEFHYFDQYKDGDDFSDYSYQVHFQNILQALKMKSFVHIRYGNGRGKHQSFKFLPWSIQYSLKDNKLRAYGLREDRNGGKIKAVINISRLEDSFFEDNNVSLEKEWSWKRKENTKKMVILRISGERNSLERCMLHFASYEKKTEYIQEENCYYCTIFYDSQDETEVLIEILSFGPVVKVLGPESFLEQVKDRIKKQQEWLTCFL